MSKALGLVKFSDGEIFETCYNGTVDIMWRFFISKEKLDKNFYGDIFYFYENSRNNTYKGPSLYDEIVEIYSDYGKGFYWKGLANKKYKCITSGIDPYNELEYDEIKDGQPNWVKKYLKDRKINEYY